MAKQFSDFSFCGKRISDLLNIKYISVEYDSDPSKSLGLERDMQKGESTRYRIEPTVKYLLQVMMSLTLLLIRLKIMRS